MVRDLEPGLVDGPGAVRLVGLFSEAEHVAAAGKAIATLRVDETRAYREAGHKSAVHWLADTTGVSVGAATHAVRAAEACQELPATSEAFRSGGLSEVQAYEIANAASADPSSEARLLKSARSRTVKGLREDCARVLAASVDDDGEWARRLHEQRAVSRWSDPGGAPRMDVRFTPEAGAVAFSALDAETDRIFREARAAGRHEPRRAYMHDALMNLITRGPVKPIDVRLSTPAAAIARGHVVDGERCELTGVGPIPVTTARMLLADASVTTMLTDADAITHVTSPNRTIPAKLRRYLEESYPTCGRSGCDNTQGLVIDHVVDYADVLRDGVLPPTTEANTWRICGWCHDLKHHHGWTITGTPGSWDLIAPHPPDDPDPP
ncbi:MAG: hypothetical protein WEC34_15895 [Acidimicrobiia bacterium]